MTSSQLGLASEPTDYRSTRHRPSGKRTTLWVSERKRKVLVSRLSNTDVIQTFRRGRSENASQDIDTCTACHGSSRS